MAQLWEKNDEGVWVPATKWARDATGWRPGKNIYEKTGASTWTLRWSNDTVAPAAPTMTATYSAVTKKITITITCPSASDTSQLVLKYNKGSVYPSTYTRTSDATTGYFVTQVVEEDGYWWSERPVTPSQVVVREFGSPAPGDTYNFGAWARDNTFNWSTRATASIKIPVPTTTTPTTVVKSAYINATDSGSWNGVDNYWRKDNNYVYQGGEQWNGAWFYGSQIRSLLAKAKRITGMKIYVQRVNSSHGVSGASSFYLSSHKMEYNGGGSPEGGWFINNDTLVGTLNRGEGKTFDVPSAWWPYFLSGGYKGLGTSYGTTTYTDPKYLYCYGKGTTSGRIWLQWEE